MTFGFPIAPKRYPWMTGQKATPPKKRHNLEPYQLMALEQEFQKDAYILAKDRYKLASDLGLTAKQVKFWFQNRRQRLKKTLAEGLSDDNYINDGCVYSMFTPCLDPTPGPSRPPLIAESDTNFESSQRNADHARYRLLTKLLKSD